MNFFSDKLSLSDLETNLNEEWKARLGDDLFRRPYWKTITTGINTSLNKIGTIIPRKDQIFASLNSFDGSNFRVLMIGQDPYPTPGNATGYAFASSRGRPTPASLKQIFKEIDQEYGSNMFERRNFNGSLDEWIDQGVLLLNTCLTIGITNDKHDQIGWQSFIGDVLDYLDRTYIFVTIALGANAIKIANEYIIKNRDLIVSAGHPSPLNRTRPFLGCKCFEQTNSKLLSRNLLPIKWVIKD